MPHTSREKTPHYSHIVHDINSRGGLKMYFARRGQQGEGWLRHLDTIMPKHGVVLHELHAVDSGDNHHLAAFHHALHNKANECNTKVLPAGFYGERTALSQAPTFKPQELLSLMPKSARHVTDDLIKRYQQLQSIREMRAAVGSLAWLAAHLGTHAVDYSARPAVLWGRTHSTSLPDMYQRLGIYPVEVRELDAPLRYTYMQPHGSQWSEDELQYAFASTYWHAYDHLSNQVATW